jgi:hypothetical protein
VAVNVEAIAYTLAVPWMANEKNKSCIPPGSYGIIRYDQMDARRIELRGVPGNRTFIEIHAGNKPGESLGCLLVGSSIDKSFSRTCQSRIA